MRSSSFVLLVGFLVAAPLVADCYDVPGNLIANCHFDVDTLGWTVDSGTPSHTGATGNPNMVSLLAGTLFWGNGAISVDSNPLVKISQCVNTTDHGSYLFFFAYFADNATEENCRVRALEYNIAGCPAGNEVDSVTQSDPILSGWESLNGSINVGVDVQSIELEVECDGVCGGGPCADASAVFDDGVLRRDYLLVDGFELGNTSRWSSAVSG